MLQHTGPGHHALFGHMADNKHGDTHALGNLHQDIRGLPHLAYAARGGCDIFPEHGLNGVNDDNLRLGFTDCLFDGVQIRLT